MEHDKMTKFVTEIQQWRDQSTESHLTDEDFVAYVLEEMTTEHEEWIETHLATCEACASSIDAYFAKAEAFPEEEWAQQRPLVEQQLRERLVDAGLSLPLPQVAAAAARALGSPVVRIKDLLRAFLQPLAVLVFQEAYAATRRPQDYVSDDERFGVFIEYVNDEVIISVDARAVELAGVLLQFSAASWQSEVHFERVTNDQVLARTIIPFEVYKDWPAPEEVELHIRLGDARAHTD